MSGSLQWPPPDAALIFLTMGVVQEVALAAAKRTLETATILVLNGTDWRPLQNGSMTKEVRP